MHSDWTHSLWQDIQFPLAVYLLQPISVYLPYLIFFLKIFLLKCTTGVLNLLFCCKSVNYIKPADGSMKQSKLCISQTTFVTIEARPNFGTMEYFLANGPSPLHWWFSFAKLTSSWLVQCQLINKSWFFQKKHRIVLSI